MPVKLMTIQGLRTTLW